MTKYLASDRAFLNQPGYHTDASLLYSLSVCKNGYFTGEISIRDCGQSVNIELDVHDEGWLENSHQKLDTMIRLLRECKKQLPKAHKAFLKAKKEKKNEKLN